MQIVIAAAVGAETLHAGESGLDLARFCECSGTVRLRRNPAVCGSPAPAAVAESVAKPPFG
jgi:hypothetical protein